MTTLCCSYGVLRRYELLEGRLLLAHAIHQPETKLALCSDTLSCQLTDLNLGGADVIATRTTIIYRHVEREADRREGAPALAVVEMKFIRSKAILIGKAQRERRHIGHTLDVERRLELTTLGDDSDEGVPTVQMPQFDRMDSFDWDSPAASQQAPQPQQAPQAQQAPQTPAVPVAPQMQVPQQPMSAAPAQPFPPVDQGAAAQQVPTAPQAPEQSGGFQESWTSQFSWSEEIRPEPQAQKKRRWPWSKRRKQKGEEEAAQALPEGNAPGATAHMPVIAVDAQDDDWQNWNSRN